MADREWFCVETPSGRKVGGTDGLTDYPNKESAVTAARNLAPSAEDLLTVVRYTRKEVRTFQKKVTVDEADLPA